jgi:hypothetical protein
MCRAVQSCISVARNCIRTHLLSQLISYATPYPHLYTRLDMLFLSGCWFLVAEPVGLLGMVCRLGVLGSATHGMMPCGQPHNTAAHLLHSS